MDNKFEYTAATPEEATAIGLEELELNRDEVDVIVIDSGNKGIFGIGARPAKIEIRLKKTGFSQQPAEHMMDLDEEEDALEPVDEKFAAGSVSDSEEDEAEEPVFAESDVVNDAALKTTIRVVEELIDKMRIKATVTGRIGALETSSNQPMILVDIKGDDLSYLIGRHSETLNALQYIASLIVGRELGHWVPMMIDVQGYRERRERQLHQMAIRMADQVIKSGRRISLEPMPGTERRMIHLILRDRTDVYTESVGEEPNRKVVIYPKA